MRPSTPRRDARPGLLAAAAAAVGLLGGCGDPLYVEAEVPRICLTQPSLAVPGGSGTATIEVRFSIDLGTDLPLLRTSSTQESDVEVDELTITPTRGTPDLSGIASATLTAGAGAAAQEVLRYARDPAAPPPSRIALAPVASGAPNVAPAFVSGVLPLTLALSGSPPATAWAADVRTCLHGKSKVSYP